MTWRGLGRRLQRSVVGVRFDPDLVPVILPEPLRGEVIRHVRDQDEVAAIRLVRQRTGLDLLSATRAVRAAGDDSG